jgi:hypothetical protein
MNIYKKLLEVKKKVPYLQKDRKKGDGLMYSYVTPGAVLSTLNPLLNEAGIFLKTEIIKATTSRIFAKKKSIDVYMEKKEKVMIDVHETQFDLDLKFTWIDTEDGERDECFFSATGVNGDDKGLGSALTYAERYFLLKTFNIPTDEDDPDNFQAKHMSEEDKKAIADKAAEKAKEDQQVAAEKKQRDINAVVSRLKSCNTVDELKELKSKTDTWILKTPEFGNAATLRFAEISTPKKELQPA